MVIKTFQFITNGVCSKRLIFTFNEEGRIIDFRAIGGCPGNLAGIRAFIKGMKPEEVIYKLDGITCGNKETSCPDQIAKALKIYLNKEREGE